ncbi:hypothetical protein D3C87_1868790 [compost metagenome]
MHGVEEMVGIDLVPQHQAVQRGAIVPVIALLQVPRRLEIELGHIHHIAGDARVDLGKQVAAARIKGVVEVEHPIGNVAEAARRRRRHVIHGRLRIAHIPEVFI